MTDEHPGPDGTPDEDRGDNSLATVIRELAEAARAFSLIPGPRAAALTQHCLDLAEVVVVDIALDEADGG